MSRVTKTLRDGAQLLQLSDLLTANIQTVIQEWAKEQQSSSINDGAPLTMLPSRRLYEAQRTLLALTGTLTELVTEPSLRILEVGCQYWETRALFIAAERHIPDMLASPDVDSSVGMSAQLLGEKTGIEHLKLCRILRTLCSNHIFTEPSPDHFANNVISAALVNNEPLRAYVLNFNLDLYAASEHMPKALLNKVIGPSYKVNETAWQDALGTKKSRWDWLEEKVSPDDFSKGGAGYPGVPDPAKYLSRAEDGKKGALVSRPEHQIFSLSMLGGGRVHGAAHPYDYPWAELGKATVVDVGSGVGGFLIQLSQVYPDLNFVLQDRGPVIKIAENEVWPKENKTALSQSRVIFMEHDFFTPNPVHGAEVYWLRSILHDWSDEYCISILSNLAQVMSPETSRILICDQLMISTLPNADPVIPSAPDPLPANYGVSVRYSHQRDLAMMGIINGIERTPDQLKVIVEKSGLKIEKVWECRSQVPIVEVRLASEQGIGGEGGLTNGTYTNGV